MSKAPRQIYRCPQWQTSMVNEVICPQSPQNRASWCRQLWDVVRSGMFADGFRDKGPREWTKQALKSPDEATESYMVEVIAESSF